MKKAVKPFQIANYYRLIRYTRLSTELAISGL
ncbi:hypothetical protein GGR06_001917 [Bacteroides reticulotermitis]|uniref:Uncharacterized protein n=1 Tax=Bacteroides reticulotermitis TaxID=1133319 RepID=A0A840D171_9BACE|nr:hypothetical protein [Bacteroides reticulotermitis]